MQRWYQRLTIYAFTSRNEGFGLTLIEAMSVGAALVAARAGAAELVVEDGITGVLTPPGDADALAAALEPLMRDPAAANAMGVRRVARAWWKTSAWMPWGKPDRGCLSHSCSLPCRRGVTFMVRSAKHVSNHEARGPSFETRASALLRMKENE